MRRRKFIQNNMMLGFAALAKPVFPSVQLTKASPEFDVVIFGATPSGIISAIRLAREGHKVLLVSVFEHIGGMMVNGLSVMDTLYAGNRAPLYEEVLSNIQNYYKDKFGAESEEYKNTLFGSPLAPGARPHYEAGVMEEIFNTMVKKESKITLWKKYEITAVTKKGTAIEKISLRSFQDKTTRWVEAKIFFDASYEGDLIAAAKVEYVVGREARSEFNEPHAGKIFALRGPGNFPYEGAKRLLNLRTFQVVTTQVFAGSTGSGDKAIQAYNARFILTNDPSKKVEIKKPDDYDRTRYLGITATDKDTSTKKYPVKADFLQGKVEDMNPGGMTLMNKKFGNNAGNYTGKNWEYPEADWQKREQITREHIDHGLGLFYFMQHDESVPQEVRNKHLAFGLSNDEFTDNNYVPYEIYVREARRMRGRFVFTENDGTSADGLDRTEIHDDSIAITEWAMDSHDCSMERKPGSLHDGVILLTEKTRPAQVPYRVLLPKTIDNLLVTVCLSATHIGWGTLRVEPTFMHIAESAAYAASMALNRKVHPARIPTQELQKKLVESGVMLSFFNEFDMASKEPWAAAIQFLSTKGYFSTYNARPDKPLSEEECTLWLKITGQVLSGSHVPGAAAREWHLMEDREKGGHISPDDFYKQLQGLTKTKVERSVTSGSTMVLRKEAASAIYGVLKGRPGKGTI